MPKIYIAEEHDQVFEVWQQRQDRALKVTHIDFHCDMRGLMIDRPRGRAFMVSPHESTFIDPGNYLGHAIMNGIISDLRWVHGPRGGRMYDTGDVVSYETDPMAAWKRWLHHHRGTREMPIAFKEELLAKWQGVRFGEHLDIDWDAFASLEYEPDHTQHLIDSFLSRDFSVIPQITFLVFSPDYSQPDRSQFEDFANQLSVKFNAELVRLPVPKHSESAGGLASLKNTIHHHIPRPVKNFKRDIVRGMRRYTTQHDLDTDARSLRNSS